MSADKELATLLRNQHGWRRFGVMGQLISPDGQTIAWPRDAAELEGLVEPDEPEPEGEA
jgi:hypothetical protein